MKNPKLRNVVKCIENDFENNHQYYQKKKHIHNIFKIWLHYHRFTAAMITTLMLSRRFSGGMLLAVGDRIVITKRIDRTDIDDFARLTGDINPIHTGHTPLVHGIYLAGLVSGVIGTKLPGNGTVLVSKSMRFPNICYAGDQVEIEVEIQSIRKLIKCGFRCRVDDKTVMEGTADVINKNVTDSQTIIACDKIGG